MLATSSIGIHTTPLGKMWSLWTTRGLYRLSWESPDAKAVDDESPIVGVDVSRQIDQFDASLESYFRNGGECFLTVKVDSSDWAPFHHRVYDQCRLIEAGSTCTYKQLAALAGSENASRAVGAAMARNRVPLVIPCHRVVSAGGNLRGFSAPGGLDTKRYLLELEQSSLF